MPIVATVSRIARLVYFMAPAYVANMAPPLIRYWRGWNRPISVRSLGGHKTVVGFGAGVLAAVVVTRAQSRIAWPGGLDAYDHWVAGLGSGLAEAHAYGSRGSGSLASSSRLTTARWPPGR